MIFFSEKMFKSRFAREMHAFSSLTLDSLSIQPRLDKQKCCFIRDPLKTNFSLNYRQNIPPPTNLPQFLQPHSNK